MRKGKVVIDRNLELMKEILELLHVSIIGGLFRRIDHIPKSIIDPILERPKEIRSGVCGEL